MRAKFVFEKFIEDSDPIKDLGIGIEQIVNKFEKELKHKISWLYEEDLFKYFPGDNLIQIDCFPLSTDGLEELSRGVKKLVKNKYSNIFEITFIPTVDDIETTKNCFIIIRIF